MGFQWFGEMLGLPQEFLPFTDGGNLYLANRLIFFYIILGKGGGVIQVS